MPGSATRLPAGGAMLNDLLKHELAKRDIRLKASSLTALKEKCANVAETAATFSSFQETENGAPEAVEFELPDGQKISIGTEGCSLPARSPSQSCLCSLSLHKVVCACLALMCLTVTLTVQAPAG